MIELLFLIMAITVSFVKETERLTASIFTFLTLCFYFINNIVPDNLYYFLAACYDLFMMSVMFFLLTASNQKLTKYLCLACFSSILIQLAGWEIAVTGRNGQIYNYAAIVFYVSIIALFITRTSFYDKLAGNNRYTARFLRDNFRRA